MFRVFSKPSAFFRGQRLRGFRYAYPSNQIKRRTSTFHRGYTLIELLVVVLILGVLAAISALSWTGFLANNTLSNAQNEIAQAIRGTRETAKRQSQDWQISLRSTDNDEVQWAAHSATIDPNQVQWQSLNSAVRLSSQTTFSKSSTNIYRLVFNRKGHVNGQLGKVILTSRSDSRKLRCVVVSTLLGAMRRGDTSSQCSSS